MKFLRVATTALGVIGGIGLIFFLLTSALDYFYVSSLVANLEAGLSDIEWANPYLGKAVIAGLGAVLCWVYYRYFAILRTSSMFGFVMVGGLGMLGISALNFVHAATGWNHYFDAYGQVLRFYCITPDNKPHFFLKQRANPWTGQPLKEVPPEMVHDIEARLESPFHEVTNPSENDWFWPGDSYPRFTYSRRPDGNIHLWSALGYDPASQQELFPATLPIKQAYGEQQATVEAKRQADAAAAEARQQQMRAEREAKAEASRQREAEAQHRAAIDLALAKKQAQEREPSAERASREERRQNRLRAAGAGERGASSDDAANAVVAQPAPPDVSMQPGSPYSINGQPPLIALLGAALSGNLHRHSDQPANGSNANRTGWNKSATGWNKSTTAPNGPLPHGGQQPVTTQGQSAPSGGRSGARPVPPPPAPALVVSRPAAPMTTSHNLSTGSKNP